MQSNNLKTLNQAAKALGISRVTLYKERKDNRIEETRVRGKVFIQASAIDNYLRRNTSSASTKEAVY